jgi:mRNA interferase HicA
MICCFRVMIDFMNGKESIRRVQRVGKIQGIIVRFESRHGKGSHGRLYYGSKFTTVKDLRQDIRKGLLNAMLNQLGLEITDIEKE